MGLADHFKKINERREQARNGFSNDGQNVWHNWDDGKQDVRFVDDFISTKVHYVGNSRKGMLKLFDDSAFSGEVRIPKMINCANWNIEKEKFEDNGCILCKINKIAREVSKSSEVDGMDKETKEEFKALKSRTDVRSLYRWKLIDRKNPFVAEGKKGYKITSLGQELFDQLCEIHGSYAPKDFTSDENGLDITVTRKNGERVSYSAQMAIEGTGLKVTPLNDEEKSWEKPDILAICGVQTDQNIVLEKLDERWKDLIEAYSNAADEEVTEKAAEKSAVKDAVKKEAVKEEDDVPDDFKAVEEESDSEAPF